MNRDSLKVLLVQGVSVEEIARRFGKHPSTVSYWMKKHGLAAPNRERHAAKGGIARARLERLVEAGMTIAEIAEDVGLSKTAVRHWLRRHGLRTKNKRGPRPARPFRAAKDGGFVTARMQCVHHGETEFVIEGRGYYRCKRCRVEAVARRRPKLKEILVEEAGGSCCLCGYDRHIGALGFHHRDPSEQRLQISLNGLWQPLEVLRAEAKECALLCSNCHAEVDAGVALLPARVSKSDGLPDSS